MLETKSFKQIESQLRDSGNGRCCLGIACDVYSVDVGGFWEADVSDDDDEPIISFVADYVPKTTTYVGEFSDNPVSDTGSLPTPVREYFGISINEDAYFARLNDLHKLTFKEIASVVRAGALMERVTNSRFSYLVPAEQRP